MQAEVKQRKKLMLRTVACNAGKHSECPGVMPISERTEGVCVCGCHKQSLFEERTA
jgi:hypothetical protein